MPEAVLSMVADEDQQMLESTAKKFFADNSPIERVRRLRDGGDELGYSKALWGQIAELGLAGLHVPEEYGGAGLSFFGLGLVMMQAGRTLVPEPFLGSILATETLASGGSEAQRAEYLPAIAAGERVVGAAYLEAHSRHDLSAVDAKATADGEGFTLVGEKVHVVDGFGADAYLVTARVGGTVEVFVVPAGAAGLVAVRQRRMDGRNVARVRLDGVRVSADARLPGGLAALARGIDHATIALAAEMIGAADQVFAETVEYIRVRKQFGVPIGSFQALQHRAGRVYIALELARSAVLAASRAVDECPEQLARYASLAKAKANDACLLAADEAVQMHGGVGVTDECNVGFYLKHARAASVTFGDGAYHASRWAEANGY